MSEFFLFFIRSLIGIDKDLKVAVTRRSSTARFATTITELLPDVPTKVPLAPMLASSIPFCAPLTETLSPVTSPGMQVLDLTWRWIDEGGTFWPLMATVQEGGSRSRWRHKICSSDTGCCQYSYRLR
jgi:hypothetical protein